MNSIRNIAAAAAAVFAIGSAQADIVLIDDFNGPLGGASVSDSTVGGGGVFMPAFDPSNGNVGPSLATSRIVGVEFTLNNNPLFGSGISATVGGGPTGVLQFTVSTGDDGTGTVQWTIPSFTVTDPAAYFFSVVASALGSIGNVSVPNVIDFHFTGTGANVGNNFTLLGQNIGAQGFSDPGTPIVFNLNPTQAAYLGGGGTLLMEVDGGQGWNLTIDEFAIQIPEPASLALVGLALVGAGVAARRRKV